MSTISKVWHGFALIFGALLLAHFLLAIVGPYIPTILCFAFLFVIARHYVHKRRRW